MKIGVPSEQRPGERRVAIAPETVRKLGKLGFEVVVETNAGAEAMLLDSAYETAGATIVETAAEAWSADIVVRINPPCALPDGSHELDMLGAGSLLIGLLWPGQNPELVDRIASRGASAIALDKIPRISRAQKMDVLSSMANIAGYRAVLEASHLYGGFFGGQMTAAGRTPPAKVLVIGAGVAGLSAIATARAMGAEVRAFDVRPAVKEQVESLGATFLEVDMELEAGDGGYAKVMSPEFIEAEMRLFKEQAEEVNIIITTALIPGRPAPLLVKEEAVEVMQPGSVIVDLATEQGGNCACSVEGEVTLAHGVHIIGYTDMTSRLPTHASQFFGTNILNLVKDLGGAEDYKLDLEDEVIERSLVVQEGQSRWPLPELPPKEAPAQPAAAVAAPEAVAASTSPETATNMVLRGFQLAGAALLGAIALWAPADFVQHFTVFVLSCFIGWQVVWNVTHALHTPLMSVTNAISGIIIVGGMLQVSSGTTDVAAILGFIAVLVASINVVGGFWVTKRMLDMFRK